MKLWLIAAFMFAPLAFAQDHGGHGRPKETSFGRPADAKKASRVVRVEMSDQMRYTPAQITVKQGEIVRFEPVNKGQVMHEMVLGTLDDLKKYAELMKKNPGMPHDAPHMAHVAPGKSGTIGWQFTTPGEFFYACLVAGHYEAGMIGKVTVQSDRVNNIKALSSDDVEQYLSGAGMGYAKAAELNRHPGPMHVLELADQLKLTAEQRTATAKLMEAHKAEARKIGARLVARWPATRWLRPWRVPRCSKVSTALHIWKRIGACARCFPMRSSRATTHCAATRRDEPTAVPVLVDAGSCTTSRRRNAD